jgi:murein DD-endopeptidase MepM/ murein hydrolase activator NlpD
MELREDAAGSGRFGARRGHRTHQGIDLLADPGEPLFAPASGIFVRAAQPYRGDRRFSGIVLNVEGYELKIFYAKPRSFRRGAEIEAGELIGYAQDIAAKYAPGPMRNHIHIEVRRIVGAELYDPSIFFGTILDGRSQT